MKLFNFFKKPIILHCYTNRADVFNFAQIEKASKFIPEKWKRIPKKVIPDGGIFPKATMKGCQGIIDLYRSGFIIPMWSDLNLEIGKIGSGQYQFQYSDNKSFANFHPSFQRGEMYPNENYQHLKLSNPWLFSCNEDINFFLAEPTWNIDKPEIVKILPGVLNFKYQPSCSINTIWPRHSENAFYTIDFGQPLVHLIPLTERKVELKLHLISSEEHTALASRASNLKFTGKYMAAKKILEARGCPFHFKAEK